MRASGGDTRPYPNGLPEGTPGRPLCGFPQGDTPARAAVLATFIALLIHTMAYAGFYEDPITWVLLAVGASLATIPVRPPA